MHTCVCFYKKPIPFGYLSLHARWSMSSAWTLRYGVRPKKRKSHGAHPLHTPAFMMFW